MKMVKLSRREMDFIQSACKYFSEANSQGGTFVMNQKRMFTNDEMDELENKVMR